MDVINTAKYIYEIILQVINLIKENNAIDFTPIIYLVLLIIFLTTLKFIYSNKVLSSDKQYRFNTETLKENINAKNSILLFRNKKIDETELLCRLNLLINFNGSDYFELISEVNIININNYLYSIESLINKNISSLNHSKLYSFSTKTFFIDKVELFIKSNNISTLFSSICISLATLYALLLGISYILNILLQNNIFTKILLGSIGYIGLATLAFFISAIDYILKEDSKKEINKTTYIISLCLFTFLILIIMLKVKSSGFNYITKNIIYFILLSISILFTILLDKIISKLHKKFKDKSKFSKKIFIKKLK